MLSTNNSYCIPTVHLQWSPFWEIYIQVFSDWHAKYRWWKHFEMLTMVNKQDEIFKGTVSKNLRLAVCFLFWKQDPWLSLAPQVALRLSEKKRLLPLSLYVERAAITESSSCAKGWSSAPFVHHSHNIDRPTKHSRALAWAATWSEVGWLYFNYTYYKG